MDDRQMDIELIETLKLIIDRYEGRTQGSVFILMKDFPWYNERNGQLTRLQTEGMITKPRFFENGTEITLTRKGRNYFVDKHWILFPREGEKLICPVCGYPAKVISTDAARSWAEINCDNCSTFALYADALEDTHELEFPILSGYYRHAHHDPMTIQCDNKESIKDHIESTRRLLTRDYQMRLLLRFYYSMMRTFGDIVEFENHPAIAYTKDSDDLMILVSQAEEKGYLRYENGFLTVTETGYRFMNNSAEHKPSVFISYNWGSVDIAEELERSLIPYADVKRDKTSVKPWGDLHGFMSSIRDQDFAVLIISDKYLKSDACLFEVMELMKEQQWDERVMYVVTEDAHGIYDTAQQLDYIGYWENKKSTLEEELKNHNVSAVTAQIEELKKYELIALNIGEFMAKVRRTRNPEMKDAINAVIERVGGEIQGSDESTVFQMTDVYEDKVSISGIEIPEALRDGWNFHNDISIRLEMKARHTFGDRDRPQTKIYDVDAIDQGKFAEVMIDILHEKTGRETGQEDIDEFIKVCSQYIGKHGAEIDAKIAQGLMDRFLELLG